jgi:hypothetical protein
MAVGGERARARRVLTVVAATVSAAAVGIGAMGMAPAGAATEKRERAQVADLLASIPQSYRSGCEIAAPTAETPAIGPQVAHVLAQVRCHPESGAAVVFVTRFDDAASMDAAYTGYNPTPGEGEDCPGSGTWTQGDEDAGKWACYLSPNNDGVANSATVVWTHDATNTLSAAYRRDDDLAALDEWWSSDDAGPLAEPDAVGIPKLLTATQWFSNSKALKQIVPASIRPSCKPMALTQESIGGTFYSRRVWLTAGVRCSADGLDNVFYVKFTRGGSGASPTDAMFADLSASVDESASREQVGTLECEGQGTWSRKKRDVGEYACFYATDDSGEFTAMAWTDRTQDVLAYATVTGADAKTLLDFWENDSGPLAATR